MLTTQLLIALLAQTPDSLLGDVGESCRARADCRTGLKCINAVCTAPAPVTKEGQGCEATSECSSDGSLRCIAKVCSKPRSAVTPAPPFTTAPPPPPPAPMAATPPAPVRDSGPPPVPVRSSASMDNAVVTETVAEPTAFSGTKFFIGLDAMAGVLTALPTLGPSVKFGWFFNKTQLSFELGAAASAITFITARASLGFCVPFIERDDFAFFWSPKAGLSTMAGAFVTTGLHADLVSFGIRTGHWLFDVQLPSIGAHLFLDGSGGLAIPVQARLAVAYVF